MIYVILILVAFIASQMVLSRYVIAGLIIPFLSIIGIILSLFFKQSTFDQLPVDPQTFQKLSSLLFLLVFLASLTLYFKARQKDLQEK